MAGLLSSEKYNAVAPAARDLYVRLILLGDDYGRYRADPRIVAREAYPIDESMTSKKLAPLMETLARVGLIVLYGDGKDRFYQITNSKQRTYSDSKYPPPPEKTNVPGESPDSTGNHGESRGNPASIIGAIIGAIKGGGDVIGDIEELPAPPPPEPTEPEPNHLYGEFLNVRLKDGDYKKLTDRLGEKTRDEFIEKLSGWMKETGKRKADHYATILNWYRRDHPNKDPENRLPDMQDIDYENQG